VCSANVPLIYQIGFDIEPQPPDHNSSAATEARLVRVLETIRDELLELE
jgi:hypothetical protein